MVNARPAPAILRHSISWVCALTLLGSCGGGGGGGGSPVTFSFEASGTTVAEDGPAATIVVVLHTSLASTSAPVSVDVADLGTGTATAGSDYAAFAPQTLTFPAGSAEGDSQSVALTPLDDLLVDGASETVRLRLENADGAGLAGTTQFTVTLTDVHAAVVDFATSVNATADETSGPQAVALELDCGAGVSLGLPVSVRVSDLRTGSAQPGSDYGSFAARTVTFPAGSAHGALQTVDVSVIDDATTEGDETVELGLSQPSAACTLGAKVTHVLTITDDDLLADQAFAGSEGASGTENALVYDELVPLGSESVGQGPNTGTLLRVTNAGGQPMALGTPELGGSHPNDFAVEIESSSLGGIGGPVAGLAAVDAASPLVPLEPDGRPGRRLGLDARRVAALRELDATTLHGLELPGAGPVTIELVRRALPLTADARLVVDGADVAGGLRTLLGELQLWSGAVVERPGSRVFLALSPQGAQGFVELPGTGEQRVHFVPEGPGRVLLADEVELQALGLEAPSEICAGERLVPGQAAVLALDELPPSTSALTVTNCRLALESDFQLFNKFGSSVLLGNYVVSQVAAVSDQYQTDVQTTLSIAYLGIHTNSNDGWSTPDGPGTASEMLTEFRNAWLNTGWATQADLAHFLSGASLGGGVAYVDVLCNASFGFGVSGSLSGSINWGTWTGQPSIFAWDFVVLAHELGHNFGSQHTHSYCPPLDQCSSNCNGSTVCSRGTLMSYCHTCGGMSNIDLEFHPVCANIMRQNVNTSCLGAAAIGPGDFVQYRVRFNPLTSAGNRSANLELDHDAPNATQPFRVRLSGTAN